MIADAFNSAGDIFTSLMTFIGNKIASKPIDDDHDLGHGKAEYIYSFLISIAMIYMSVIIFKDSLMTLINQDKYTYSIWLIIVCLITIIIKISLYIYTNKIAKKYNNILIKANSKDHLIDAIITTLNLVSCILAKYNIYILEVLMKILDIWYKKIKCNGELVTINGNKAKEENGVYTAQVYLDAYRNAVEVNDAETGEMQTIYVYWFRNGYKTYRLGVDDVILCFKNIFQKPCKKHLIFFVISAKLFPLLCGDVMSSHKLCSIRSAGRCDKRRCRTMAKCDYCGKSVTFGIRVSHSHRRSNRCWKANIRRVKAIVDGSPKRVYACTRCLRSGKVTRAV